MTTYLSDHNKAGFEHWAKLNNLKEAARTFNYLSEHNLLNYEDFKNHVADSADAIQATESNAPSFSFASLNGRYFPVSISLYSLNTIFTIGSKSFFSGME